MPTLVLASGNAGKLREFSSLLAPLNWDVQPQSAYAVPDCPEPHPTFIENALAKARHAAAHTGLPALADDSGLCVAALGGAPGVLSARYAIDFDDYASHKDAANNAKLLQALAQYSNRWAYFVAVLVALREPADPEPLIAIGRWQGQIAHAPSGQGGFGYDPLFVCAQTGLSAAAMSAAQKSAHSHRGQASAQMLDLIQKQWHSYSHSQ